MFDSLNRSAARQQAAITSALEHLDYAWRTMRTGTRASGLTRSAQGLIKQLPGQTKDLLGWNDALADATNTDAIFERLAATNLFLIYQGRTPTSEVRPYVFGAAEDGTLWGVLFALGEVMTERDSLLAPEYDLYLARPDTLDASWWRWERIPASLVEAFVRLTDASGGAGSTSEPGADSAPEA